MFFFSAGACPLAHAHPLLCLDSQRGSMVTMDDGGGGGGGGGGRPPMTIDSLRADLAETKLLNHDLTKQLEETKAKLEDAESRAMIGTAATAGQDAAGGASDDGDASITKAATAAQGTHNKEQTDIIKRLEKEVNGLNTKTRMLEVHNNLLVEQEKELRASFDQVLLFGGLLVVALILVLAAELTGMTDIMDMHGKAGPSCDCMGAEKSAPMTHANNEL